MRFAVIFIALLVAFASPAFAYLSFCYEPSRPQCVTPYSSFNSKFDFDMCKSEVERYLLNIKIYKQCVADEAIQKIQEANDNANKLVKSFNCMASGESFCY